MGFWIQVGASCCTYTAKDTVNNDIQQTCTCVMAPAVLGKVEHAEPASISTVMHKKQFKEFRATRGRSFSGTRFFVIRCLGFSFTATSFVRPHQNQDLPVKKRTPYSCQQSLQVLTQKCWMSSCTFVQKIQKPFSRTSSVTVLALSVSHRDGIPMLASVLWSSRVRA